MKSPFKVVIIEPSLFIRSGVISVLYQLNLVQMDVLEFAKIEQLKGNGDWKNPNLLIINPQALGMLSFQQFKKDSANPKVKCIALQTSLFDTSMLKAYDEVISLYDSFEQITEKLTKLMVDPELSKRQEVLTLREKEIIIFIVKGFTNKQIAEKLFLSTHTIISHRRNIAVKLQIHSAAGLTIYAIVNKLVELDEIKDLPISFNE
jgi:DNA-binding NarL/FixJ family response regulator